MTKKILYFAFILMFFFGVAGFVSSRTAYAVDQIFPAGCSSAVGYSATTGRPCNGTNVATMQDPGCGTIFGYSQLNGKPCSGTSTAITVMAGCQSLVGYSSVSGRPCNGSNYAYTAMSVSPGFPRAGADGEALANGVMLGTLGIIVLTGLVYLGRRRSHAHK